uniref:Bromoheptapeptide Im n=1 Tax=Conus imperialis TaxID=35631 RepID=BRHP_CONIM|nr:RecName: Full=Bromoheptapeptide Im [Conus imperialis]
QCGQAWC